VWIARASPSWRSTIRRRSTRSSHGSASISTGTTRTSAPARRPRRPDRRPARSIPPASATGDGNARVGPVPAGEPRAVGLCPTRGDDRRGAPPTPPTGSVSSMSPPDALSDALAELDALRGAGLAAFAESSTPGQVEAARVEYLGQKQGRVKAAQERL